MLKVALLGASGFIGSRAVETFYLGKHFQILPVVRNYTSLARSARFDMGYKIADSRDRVELASAFTGCDAVVDCVLGDPAVITQSAESVYQAANDAHVKRLIYLSSSAVHTQTPAPGTNETTPISTVQPFPYNQAKVKAERKLFSLREQLSTELVVLRPSIVFGPRSFWVKQLADQLLHGSACLINDGKGILNSIYVDNLIETIRLCLCAENIDKEVFLVGDEEQVTWQDFYRVIASGLGINFATIHQIEAPEYTIGWRDVAGQIRASTPVQKILPLVPQKLKSAVKAALSESGEPHSNGEFGFPQSSTPTVSKEMSLLQQCHWQLSSAKAKSLLGYKPIVTFEEGCRRSLGWLKFSGYPVQ